MGFLDLGLLARANSWAGRQTFSLAQSFASSTSTATSAGTLTATLTTAASPPIQNGDATLNPVLYTLPTTTATAVYTITKIDGSANTVGISPGSGAIGGVAATIYLRRQYDSVVLQGTGSNNQWRIVGGTFNPLKPAADPLYTNLTIPAGNTVSATGTGVANQQTAFTSGPTIPANYFYPGMRVVLRGWGYYTATAAVNVQPEVYAGGTSGIKLIDAGALGLPSTQANCRYDFEIWLKCRSAGTSGVLECYGRLIFMNPTANAAGALTFPVGTNGSANSVGSSTVTYDTTVSRLIQLTAAYSSATSGDTNTLVHIEAVAYPPGAGSS